VRADGAGAPCVTSAQHRMQALCSCVATVRLLKAAHHGKGSSSGNAGSVHGVPAAGSSDGPQPGSRLRPSMSINRFALGTSFASLGGYSYDKQFSLLCNLTGLIIRL